MVPAPHPEWYETQPRQALTATNRQQCCNSTLCCNVCCNVQTWSPPCHSNVSRGASTSLASAPTAELVCSDAGTVVLSRSDAELVRARAVHMRCAESAGEHGRLSTRGQAGGCIHQLQRRHVAPDRDKKSRRRAARVARWRSATPTEAEDSCIAGLREGSASRQYVRQGGLALPRQDRPRPERLGGMSARHRGSEA